MDRLLANLYGSFCTAPIYTTTFTSQTANSISWGAKTGTSDIVHTTNTSNFLFQTPGVYVVKVSFTSQAGSTVGIAVTLLQSGASNWVQTCLPVPAYTTVDFTFPLVTIQLFQTLAMSLYPTGSGFTVAPTCSSQGANVAGSLACSFINIMRIG